MPYADKELGRQKMRERYWLKRDELAAKQSEYRKNNPEIIRQQRKNKYAALTPYEKECLVERARIYQSSPEYKAKKNAKRREEYDSNKLDRNRSYYQENKESLDKYTRLYQRTPEYRAKVNARNKKRAKDDPKYRANRNIRSRFGRIVESKKCGASITALLGCSKEFFNTHIESQFTAGMNWGNYGTFGWHIDHRLPLAGFDLTKLDELSAACHYTNLQPMWWHQNLSKGAKGCRKISSRLAT